MSITKKSNSKGPKKKSSRSKAPKTQADPSLRKSIYNFRISPEERAVADRLVAKIGVTNLAGLIRMLLTNAARVEGILPPA